MTWRVLRTELLRGTAPVVAVAVAVAGAAMLFNETEDWAGRWGPLAEYLRVVLFALLAFAVAAGAWQAGRERRRRIGELLGSTARPDGQQVLVAWAAVALGAVAGLLLAWGSGAVLVARVATYGGGWWWLTLSVAFVGVVAASAVGAAVGRLVPGRLAAPVAGVLAFLLIGTVSAAGDSSWAWLTPTMPFDGPNASYIEPGFQLLQLGWFAALAVTALLLAARPRSWLAAVPGVLAAVAAVAIVSQPGDEHREQDPAALELVCTDDDGPEVCLTSMNAFLLDDAVGPVREQLARWEGVDGGFTRAVDELSVPDGEPAPEGTAMVILEWLVSWDGGLSAESEHGDTMETVFAQAAGELVFHNCDPYGDQEPVGSVGTQLTPAERRMVSASEVAYEWAMGESVAIRPPSGETLPSEVLLERSEAEQEEWMGRYMAAAHTCAMDEFTELMSDL